MPTWSVGLTGDRHDLKALAGLSLGVTEDADGFRFRSPAFDAMTEERDVSQYTKRRLPILSGLLRLNQDDGKPHTIEMGAVFQQLDGNRVAIYVTPKPITLNLTGRAGRVVLSGEAVMADGSDPPPPPNPFPAWDALAMRDDVVARALRFFAETPSAESLWKVYEVIRDDMGGVLHGKSNIVKAGWATNAEVDSFRSVHYPSALGDDARHGVEPTKQPAPVNPMTLKQGRALIRRLMVRWLAAKT